MNDLENQSPARNDLAELHAQYDALRQLVNTILILLVIVSGTLTIFLLREYKAVHKEVVAVRPQYTEAVARFEQMKPKMEDFERRITEFARTHPEFAAIIAKYAPRRPAAAAPAAPTKK